MSVLIEGYGIFLYFWLIEMGHPVYYSFAITLLVSSNKRCTINSLIKKNKGTNDKNRKISDYKRQFHNDVTLWSNVSEIFLRMRDAPLVKGLRFLLHVGELRDLYRLYIGKYFFLYSLSNLWYSRCRLASKWAGKMLNYF